MTYLKREIVIKCHLMKSHSHPVEHVLREKQAGDKRPLLGKNCLRLTSPQIWSHGTGGLKGGVCGSPCPQSTQAAVSSLSIDVIHPSRILRGDQVSGVMPSTRT